MLISESLVASLYYSSRVEDRKWAGKWRPNYLLGSLQREQMRGLTSDGTGKYSRNVSRTSPSRHPDLIYHQQTSASQSRVTARVSLSKYYLISQEILKWEAQIRFPTAWTLNIPWLRNSPSTLSIYGNYQPKVSLIILSVFRWHWCNILTLP